MHVGWIGTGVSLAVLGAGAALVFRVLEPGPTPNERQATVRLERLQQRAFTIVDRLTQGQYEEVSAEFAGPLRDRLTPATLRQMWQTFDRQAGPITRDKAVRVEHTDTYDVFYVRLSSSKGPLDVKIVFLSDDKVGGLFVVPAAAVQVRGGM